MILGIGCDIVRISRMLKIVPVFKKGMQQHILSAAEQEEALSEMELLIRSLEERQRKEAFAQVKTAIGFLGERRI